MQISNRKKENKMIDTKNQNLNAIVDSLASLYNIHDPRVIESATGDIETYINDDHDDVKCFDSIPLTEFTYALTSNLMQYGKKMDALRILWAHDDVELDGYIARGTSSAIDWDQAVDDDGHAVYDLYFFSMDVAPKSDDAPDYKNLTFAPSEIEAFARTW